MTDVPVRLGIVAPSLPARLGLRALMEEIEGVETYLDAPSFHTLQGASAGNLGDLDILLVMDDSLNPQFFFDGDVQVPAVLLLSDHPENAGLFADNFQGPWGLLPVDCTLEELSAAITALHAGLWVGDFHLFQRAVGAGTSQPADELSGQQTRTSGAGDVEELTNRELEVLEALSQGMANKQIALELGISENTVKFHISSIYTKLGATNRTEAVRFGVQKGFITL